MMSQVKAKRLSAGKRLVPSGEGARIRKEKAANSRKEAKEAATEDQGRNKTISFGTGSSKSKTTKSVKSALKKDPKETIKTYKYELIVDVRVRLQYTRKKNEVRKQVYACLGEGLKFTRNTLLEGKTDVTVLGKEGRKSEKEAPIRTTADLPPSAFELTKWYACVSNPYSFLMDTDATLSRLTCAWC